MNWNKWIRQIHRWLSVLFTAAVVVNGAVVLRGKYSTGLGLAAVAPLALLSRGSTCLCCRMRQNGPGGAPDECDD